MKKKPIIVFLSVGSYAQTSDLVYSQMLKLGDAIHSAGEYIVKSFIFLPISSCVQRYRKILPDMKDIKSNIKHEVNFGINPINKKLLSFFLRGFFTKFIVYRLENTILKNLDCDTPVILHCRNYYSAFAALKLKERHTRPIKTVFDTRGLMQFEVPYISRFGSFMFGPLHCWEHELIELSDAVLVQAQTSKAYLELVHGAGRNISYLPISGFPKIRKHKNIGSRFNNAWRKKQFLYVGSLGHWNAQEKLLHSFSMISNCFDEEIEFLVATTEPFSVSDEVLPFKIKFTTVPYDSVHELYNESLALIVAGSPSEDFFSQANMRINYFSTKAAEALSLGVPILVSDDLTELAAFVDLNDCGFKLSHFDKSQNNLLNSNGQSRDERAWARVSENADKIGNQFLAENVHMAYEKIWKKLIGDASEAE